MTNMHLKIGGSVTLKEFFDALCPKESDYYMDIGVGGSGYTSD